MAEYTEVFSGVMAMINARSERYFTDGGEAQQVTVSYVTSGYMSVLGLSPSRGRWFEELHDVPGGTAFSRIFEEIKNFETLL